MATLTTQQPAITGTVPTANVAAAGGDKAAPVGDSPLFLRITNGNAGASRTVTINDPTSATPTSAKSFDPDVEVVVAQSTSRIVKLPANRFKNPANGLIEWTYSSEADLTIEVYA